MGDNSKNWVGEPMLLATNRTLNQMRKIYDNDSINIVIVKSSGFPVPILVDGECQLAHAFNSQFPKDGFKKYYLELSEAIGNSKLPDGLYRINLTLQDTDDVPLDNVEDVENFYYGLLEGHKPHDRAKSMTTILPAKAPVTTVENLSVTQSLTLTEENAKLKKALIAAETCRGCMYAENCRDDYLTCGIVADAIKNGDSWNDAVRRATED